MEDVIARGLQLFLALAGAYLLALWFALIVWTYRDIVSRSTNPVTHIFSTLVVVLFFVPGALIYLVLRPRETLDEAFQRSMEEEYLLQDLDDFPVCPVCRRSVREDFVFCPHCSAELRHACRACRRLVDLRWEICPYCGAEQFGSVPEQPVAVDDVDGDRRGRRGGGTLQPIDGGRSRNRTNEDDASPGWREQAWTPDEMLAPVQLPTVDARLAETTGGDQSQSVANPPQRRRRKNRAVRDQD